MAYNLRREFKDIGYLDGFAGRGIYPDTRKFGSPILALQSLSLNDKAFNSCHCIFVEKDCDNYKCLEEVIEGERSTFSSSITIEVFNEEFENILPNYLQELTEKPFFVFLDPFGFNLSFQAIEEILCRDQNEVFITLMTKDINRFLSSESHKPALIRLMGGEEYLEGLDSQEAIVKRYIERLEEVAEYTLRFAVGSDERKENIYYLIHACNHFKGFKLMKDTMFNQGKGKGEFAYRGILDSKIEKLDLFVDRNKGTRDVYNYFKKHFKNKKVSFQLVCEQIYRYTNYVDKHCKSVLNELEKKNLIQIRSRRKRRGGFEEDDIIIFSPPDSKDSLSDREYYSEQKRDQTNVSIPKELTSFFKENKKKTEPKGDGMIRKQAKSLARSLIQDLISPTVKIEIAGSIRRQKPYVKDIELVAKIQGTGSPIEKKINLLEAEGKIKIEKNGQRYKQLVLLDQKGQELIKVDLFIVKPPAQWGVIYLLRTGSAAFSKRFVTEIKPEFRVKNGVLEKKGLITDELGTRTIYQGIKTPTEKAVFRAVGWEYVEPEKRIK